MEDRQRTAAIALYELTPVEVASLELLGLPIDPLGLVGPAGNLTQEAAAFGLVKGSNS